MSGYRQSSYDPNAGYEEPRPLKPLDKWQWFGKAAIGVAALLVLANLIWEFGGNWPRPFRPQGVFVLFFVGGLLLVRYRREPREDEPHPETSERRRRFYGLAIIAIGVAVVAYNILTGAK